MELFTYLYCPNYGRFRRSTQREVIQCNHPILGAAREGQKHVLLDVDISPPHPPLKNEYITTASSEKLPTGHRNNTQFYTIMF